MRPLRPFVLAVVAVVSAGVVFAPAPAGAADAVRAGKEPVPSPKVTGPVAGQAASLSAVDLAAHGYVEEEFFLEGTARAYEPTGPLAADGRWSVKTSTTAPYRTRVLVRRPKDPSKFKGTVEVEWLNVSGGLDAAPDWGLGHAELLRSGFVWVGVSAQATGIKNLQSNPDRYGTLDHPGDAYSYDIYSQAAEALRRPSGTNVLGRKFGVKRLIADGESQSAFRMVTYVNAIQPLTRMFDGFFVHSRFSNGSAFAEGGSGAIPNPTFIRTDGKAPVLVLESETDVPRHLSARQPGNARGGIRLPQLEAPTATLSGEPGGGPGFCSLLGFTAAFDAARLASLYPTQRDY